MFKYLKYVLLITILFAVPTIATANEADIYLDGTRVKHATFYSRDNRAYISQQFINELGGTVNTNGNFITIEIGQKQITMQVNSNDANVNGKQVNTAPPVIKNGQVALPVRFIGENLGATVSWVDGVVWITTHGGPKPPKNIYYKDRAVVLMYHHFDDNEQGCTISAERFKKHMQMLEQKGFNVVSLDRVGRFLKGHAELPVNAVALTFDDGYASNYHVAYPVLKEKDWPATIFVIISKIGVYDWLTRLNWTQVKELSRNNITIYSHTYDSHDYITDYKGRNIPKLLATKKGETNVASGQRILKDLEKSRQKLIGELGGRSEHLSLPYGRWDNRVLELARQAGYKYIWTIEPRAVTKNSSPSLLGRVDAGTPKTDEKALKEAILKAAKK